MKALSNCRADLVAHCLANPLPDEWVVGIGSKILTKEEVHAEMLASLHPQPTDLCMHCGVDAFDIGHYYMLHNALWLSINPKDTGKLCLFCVEKVLGRPVTRADFNDASINSNVDKLLS